MILDYFFTQILNLLLFVVDALPSLPPFTQDLSLMGELLSYGAYFFTGDVIVASLATVIFWNGLFLYLNPIKWSYRKIPGIT